MYISYILPNEFVLFTKQKRICDCRLSHVRADWTCTYRVLIGHGWKCSFLLLHSFWAGYKTEGHCEYFWESYKAEGHENLRRLQG